MITYNNIVSKFEEFVDNHHFLKTFSHGSPSGVDLDKFETYPLLHLVYTGGGYDSNIKTYTLEIYILDNPPRQDDKTEFQKSVVSQCEMVAEDILADIQNGGNIFSFGHYYELQSATITPLENESTNILAGSLLNLSIGVTYAYDACNAPIDGVDPDGSIPQPFKARGLLRVKEVDGDPDVTSVATINVPDGSLTDNGDGEITLTFAAGGDSTRLVQTVKNVSGGELAKGTPVHAVLDGTSGNIAHVIAARADTASAMPATFVLNETLADEAEGEAIITGLLQGVDTSAFQPGDVVYVGATGGYTNLKPQGSSNLVQNLGIVLKSHASNGSGIVYGSGRANDVPNLSIGHFFIGGQQTYGIESLYAFPTTEPNDGDILVYNDTLDRFDAVPHTTPATSTIEITSTESGGAAAGGSDDIDFGGLLAGTDITIDQTLNRGFVAGFSTNTSSREFNATPLAMTSTFDLTFSVEILAFSGAFGDIVTTKTGFFDKFSQSITIIGDGSGTYQTYTMTQSNMTADVFQYSNTLRFTMRNLFGTASMSWRNPTLTLTINHA